MKWFRFVAVVLPLMLLGACSTPQAAPGPMPGAYPMGGPTFHLDVAEITIQRVAAPGAGTAIDMTDAVDSWLRRHLVPVGRSGRVQATINDAAIRESVLRRTAPGGTSFVRTRQFDGLIDVRLDATDRSTQRVGFAAGSASRSQAVPDDMAPADSGAVAAGMADALMADFQASLGADLQRRLGRFLR